MFYDTYNLLKTPCMVVLWKIYNYNYKTNFTNIEMTLLF